MSVVIVTGALRGIGRAIADVILADVNAKVVAVARSQDKLADLSNAYPGRVAVVAGDVTDHQVLVKAVETAVSQYGKLDAVVLNAGVIEPVGAIDAVLVAKWRQHFDVNVFSLVDLIATAMPELRKLHGRIVAVLLGASTHHYTGWYAYGCGKAAVNHLIMSIAEEEPDVTAILIAPGVVKTDMQSDIRTKCADGMGDDAQKFHDLHANDQLLEPDVPGTVYAKLALNGWDKLLNGQYLRFNDDALKAYQK